MVTATEKFLTDDELAEVLRIDPCTVRNLARNGELPFVQVGRRRRYLVSQVVAARTQQPVTKTEVLNSHEDNGPDASGETAVFEA